MTTTAMTVTTRSAGTGRRPLRMVLLAAVSAGMVAGCTPGEQRTAGLTVAGAGIGALVGGAVGGTRGALVGAAIGGTAGLVTGLYLDEVERQQAREAALAAARTGSATRSFRNSRGDRVVVTSRRVRSYEQGGQRLTEVRRTVVRNGQQVGEETVTAREVRLASGRTELAIDG